MKTRNRLTKWLALVALSLSLVVIAAVWRVGRVAAVGDPNIRPVEFGLISLAPGQTARLNAVSLGGPDTSPGDERLARRVRLAFDIYSQSPTGPDGPNPTSLDDTVACPNNLRFLRRESCDVTLRPGHAASLDFVAPAGARIDASIHFLGGPDTIPGDNRRGPEPHLTPTLEVMEAGRTIFTHPALVKGFNPQPDPPGRQ